MRLGRLKGVRMDDECCNLLLTVWFVHGLREKKFHNSGQPTVAAIHWVLESPKARRTRVYRVSWPLPPRNNGFAEIGAARDLEGPFGAQMLIEMCP
jgi:hypothetical protein